MSYRFAGFLPGCLAAAVLYATPVLARPPTNAPEVYDVAVEYACGQDPRSGCIRNLVRLCGRTASKICMHLNKDQLEGLKANWQYRDR